MTTIFALAGLNASDYTFVNQAGQDIIYQATTRYLEFVNSEMQGAVSMFMQPGTTTNFAERYKLPGSGITLQRSGGQDRPAAQSVYGGYDVAYPLEQFEAAVAQSRIDMAYMSPQAFQLHVDSVRTSYERTMRREILSALLTSTNATFIDPIHGSLTIRRLANTDSTLYPPVIGSDTEAEATHYLASGYAASTISDTNNPFPTMLAKLTAVYGNPTGGANIVALINSAQTAKVQALTEFVTVGDIFIAQGVSTATPINLPSVPGTARVLGRLQDTGVWVAEWAYIPANYIYMQHMAEEKPLKMRVDPVGTGLGAGLQLVKQDENYPLQTAIWSLRFGIGVANRLNGVAMFLDSGSTYTDPTIS